VPRFWLKSPELGDFRERESKARRPAAEVGMKAGRKSNREGHEPHCDARDARERTSEGAKDALFDA